MKVHLSKELPSFSKTSRKHSLDPRTGLAGVMESLHSPLHGPAFIPDLKENLDTSPRKKTKQNTNSEPETRLATD